MNAVERVKALCKARGTPLYKLERDLGFANGYIGQLKKGTIPGDRVAKIAEYFDVTTGYILTGEEDLPEDAPGYYLDHDARDLAYFLHRNPGYKVLFDATRKVKPEDIEFVRQLIDRMSE